MRYTLRYSRFNEYSILIEWPVVIDDFMLENILNFKNTIKINYVNQKVEVINTYNSILVIYQITIEDVNDEILTLKTLFLAQGKAKLNQSTIWEIPVCYDDEFAADLDVISNKIKLSKPEIIRRHSEPMYTVFFIGFLPGFLYLGGLDSGLFLDRKTTPNLNVKKGSVAIGGQQTGIYPQDSPGGWHSIGNSPIELFNPKHMPPCLIKAGDKVKFIPIETLEYYDILNAVKTRKYKLKSICTYA